MQPSRGVTHVEPSATPLADALTLGIFGVIAHVIGLWVLQFSYDPSEGLAIRSGSPELPFQFLVILLFFGTIVAMDAVFLHWEGVDYRENDWSGTFAAVLLTLDVLMAFVPLAALNADMIRDFSLLGIYGSWNAPLVLLLIMSSVRFAIFWGTGEILEKRLEAERKRRVIAARHP